MGKLWKWFLGLFKTAWFKAFLMFAVERLKKIFEQVGKEAYEKIRAKVIDVASLNISNTEKLKAVFKYVKELVPALSDSAVNYLIESIIQDLKNQRKI